MKKSVLACLAMQLLVAPAWANDTTAVLDAGGLVFTRQDNIAMESEDLFISEKEVRVDYVFRNEADTDLETVVAFPMPEIGGSLEFMAGMDDTESDNFMGFTVSQDGKPIEPKLQQRATVSGIDVTDDLVAAGVSLMPVSQKAISQIANLPEAVQKDWETRGIILNTAYSSDGAPVKPDYYPLWTLKSVFWWKTTFPGDSKVSVSHRYRPSVGGTVAMVFIQDGKPTDFYNEYKERYCIDDAFMKTAAKLEKEQNPDANKYYFERWLSYILTTGANWAGPIEKFKLTVDKGSPNNYVSFCGQNVKKVGPTKFEMVATDFYPEKDLHILLVVPTDLN